MNNRYWAKHPLFAFVLLPIVGLVILTIASGAAEILLDHFVFGRANNGMPLLFTLPWARSVVTGWNLAVVYVAPVLIALWVWKTGSAHNVRKGWLWSGGLMICVLGGLHYLETRWTGIKGTSTLLIGPVSDGRTALLRIAANVFLFVLGVWLLKQRRAT